MLCKNLTLKIPRIFVGASHPVINHAGCMTLIIIGPPAVTVDAKETRSHDIYPVLLVVRE